MGMAGGSSLGGSMLGSKSWLVYCCFGECLVRWCLALVLGFFFFFVFVQVRSAPYLAPWAPPPCALCTPGMI
jgi:hypothetical protein